MLLYITNMIHSLLCCTGRRIGRYALNGTVESQHFATGSSDVDIEEYILNNADSIRELLSSAVDNHTCIKWFATIDVQFYRSTADGKIQQTTARFRTTPDVLSDTTTMDVNSIAREFVSSAENFNKRGSNWLIDLVVDFLITLAPYRPMQLSLIHI